MLSYVHYVVFIISINKLWIIFFWKIYYLYIIIYVNI